MSNDDNFGFPEAASALNVAMRLRKGPPVHPSQGQGIPETCIEKGLEYLEDKGKKRLRFWQKRKANAISEVPAQNADVMAGRLYQSYNIHGPQTTVPANFQMQTPGSVSTSSRPQTLYGNPTGQFDPYNQVQAPVGREQYPLLGRRQTDPTFGAGQPNAGLGLSGTTPFGNPQNAQAGYGHDQGESGPMYGTQNAQNNMGPYQQPLQGVNVNYPSAAPGVGYTASSAQSNTCQHGCRYRECTWPGCPWQRYC